MTDGKHRVVLDDEALRCICTALRSLSKAGHQSEYRRTFCTDLATRLAERSMGNPNLVHKGRLKREEPLKAKG